MKENKKLDEIDPETQEKVDKLFDGAFEASDKLKKLCRLGTK